MNKLLKLRVERYSNTEEEKSLSDLNSRFEVQYMKGSSLVANLVFKKQALSSEKSAYWVLSSDLKRWARVSSSRTESLEKDLGRLIPPRK